MTREEAHATMEKAGSYEFINGYGHFCIPKHQMWETIDSIYDDFEKRNVELEQRVKELEQENKKGFQALHCPSCQGGGCPICGGSGFVVGRDIKDTKCN